MDNYTLSRDNPGLLMFDPTVTRQPPTPILLAPMHESLLDGRPALPGQLPAPVDRELFAGPGAGTLILLAAGLVAVLG